MTYATDAGFEVGELYEVVNAESNSYYVTAGMILRMERDDLSELPPFRYHSGPKTPGTDYAQDIYVSLKDLKPVETPIKTITDLELLKAYVAMHYSEDRFLSLLVSKL